MITHRTPAHLRQDAKLCIALRQEDKERLSAIAAQQGITLSYVLREIIRDHLARADKDGK
jgi:predicted DNA-binding protein